MGKMTVPSTQAGRSINTEVQSAAKGPGMQNMTEVLGEHLTQMKGHAPLRIRFTFSSMLFTEASKSTPHVLTCKWAKDGLSGSEDGRSWVSSNLATMPLPATMLPT
eukprot:1158780-Pelagomonas_calceolata.AAC.15